MTVPAELEGQTVGGTVVSEGDTVFVHAVATPFGEPGTAGQG